jgi:amino acid transporter
MESEIIVPENRPGSRYIRTRMQFTRTAPNTAEARADVHQMSAGALTTDKPSFWRTVRLALIGTPIPTEQALHERIGKAKALAVLSSDALSSVAYGTEASLAVLITAGVGSMNVNLLLGATVVLLLAIVAFSYRQTIFHYPNGGGSYIVAKDNLNVHFGLVAAAALLIDYVLTVSVSISSGVDALVSSFGQLAPYNVPIGVGLIVLMVIVNLRGVRESGTIFAAPTYVFVGSFMFMIVVGLFRAIASPGGLVHNIAAGPSTIIPNGAFDHLSAFLILTAFASGCSAMTGTEAISNGVPIFKQPQSKNAAQTLIAMAVLLGIMYGGTTFLAWRFGISPQANSNPTVIHQLAQTFFGGWLGWFTYFFDFATTAILVLAANTSFADFPRLSSILARDDYLPHIFSAQGDRLAFNTGILVLASLSAVLLVVFHGNTEALINLYALGVFAAFTLSQSGMVRRWVRTKEPGWRQGLAINLLGALATGIVTIIIGVSKFDRGAWIVVILIPLLYLLFESIHRHYHHVRDVALTIPVRKFNTAKHLVIVPIAQLDNLALRGLAYARALSPYVIAVHVALTTEEAEQIRAKWERLVASSTILRNGPPLTEIEPEPINKESAQAFLGPFTGPELVIVDSPYRALTKPIVQFIDALQRTYPDELITVVLPEFVTTHFWESALHNQTVLRLKLALLGRPHVVTANVPYRLIPGDQPKPARLDG